MKLVVVDVDPTSRLQIENLLRKGSSGADPLLEVVEAEIERDGPTEFDFFCSVKDDIRCQ